MKEFAEKNQGMLVLGILILAVIILAVVMFKTDEVKDGYSTSKVFGVPYKKTKIADQAKPQTQTQSQMAA